MRRAPNPRDPRDLARWAIARVDELGRDQALWLRVTLDGPGWVLTESERHPPKGGTGWSCVATIDTDTAYRVCSAQRDAWTKLVNLGQKIAIALGPHVVGGWPP